LKPETIYHIADKHQWERAQSTGFYVHPSLNTEGFIHCSTAKQVEDTANLYFSNDDDILILHIDTSALSSEVKYEMASRGEPFPHIYGPINIESVIKSKKVKRSSEKKFKLTV
jgi:uncharacterized protein (DUF952 family)